MALPLKIELTVSQTEVLADLLATDNVAILNEIVQAARSVVAAGGALVLTENFDNAPPAILVTYDAPDKVENWVKDINKLRASLGQTKLG